MNKKIISLLLASSLLVSFQFGNSNPASASSSYLYAAVDVDNLVDVSPNHWAYDAVKLVVEDLGIMEPKTPTRFMGNDVATRYELARVFYNAVKKLEGITGKDLRVTEDRRQVSLTDVDDANRTIVDAVVNEYGIMQAMPGNKFMGNEKMSRYELAFELNNYLTLLERQVGRTTLEPVNRTETLTDIKEEHWATPAVRNIVNKYQIMVGYPDNTFRGFQTLTRYETAAVLRRFVDYVDKYLVPLSQATPTPQATPESTPMPESTPSPEITPMPIETKKPLSMFDLKVGGQLKTAYLTTAKQQLGLLYGPNADLKIWFPKVGDVARFGLGANATYLLYDNNFNTATGLQNLSRVEVGGELLWRALGADSDEDASLTLGIGYEYLQWVATNYSYYNHGPKGVVGLEIPIGGFMSLVFEDQFQYFPLANNFFSNNILWKNDGFAGINIPAATAFSVQLGYKDTRYSLVGKDPIFGDIGGVVNLRVRF